MRYAVKTEVREPDAESFTFTDQKTMYGGKRIAVGDTVFVFASELQGGRGLVARGVVTSAVPVPRIPGVARQTPRVSLVIRRTGLAVRSLGRLDVAPFAGVVDRPEAEVHFKFYRQATNKVVGLSEELAAFLEAFF